MPVNPENAAQQGALTAWMRIKTDEWHANAEDWDAMTDVDHITISEASALPKRPHVEQLVQQHAAFGGANPGTPIIAMKLADFGNVVVMTDLEGRNSAKPSGFAMRLFIDRGTGWKICLERLLRRSAKMRRASPTNAGGSHGGVAVAVVVTPASS